MSVFCRWIRFFWNFVSIPTISYFFQKFEKKQDKLPKLWVVFLITVEGTLEIWSWAIDLEPYWIKNRRKEEWKQREKTNTTGGVTSPILKRLLSSRISRLHTYTRYAFSFFQASKIDAIFNNLVKFLQSNFR